ncbi:hypothetical protein FMN63_26305 [Stappia sp. BW2]|uniref:MlrC C-terminal domain-containing protein n=1 Tax=Stappia sp. BW2 TaxID=2592622 RepID=UPI0011DE9DB9|nr:MlrC C-terminal domain-containing protein [Stappia sp. BW2]TYC65871.1 hypothetical protein FMN63_26305 [Stappia sp. BW2]
MISNLRSSPFVRPLPVKLVGTGGETARDRDVLIEVADNKTVLTKHRRPILYFDNFRRFEIEPWTVSCLIVKSGYLSPELGPIAKPARTALTDGRSIRTSKGTKTGTDRIQASLIDGPSIGLRFPGWHAGQSLSPMRS